MCIVIPFSCVTSELFCDGTGLFDLSQLLAYRTGDYNPDSKLQKIDDGIKVTPFTCNYSKQNK